MTFKEWLYNEFPSFRLPEPVQISVLVNGKPTTFLVDGIDIRAEDWNLEAGDPRYALNSGVSLHFTPKPPRGPFSAPLADGRFLNYERGSQLGAEVGSQALYPVIRRDWADFAEFTNGNNSVKQPAYLRTADARVG